MNMKCLLPLLILITCRCIQGVLVWTVFGKVTEYGQNVTLFCNVSNCCPNYAGWDRWTPVQQTLFIDVKTGQANAKYDGKALQNGYTLVIQNLSKTDLNVSYSCVYGAILGQRKFLLEEDVFYFISTTQPNINSRLSQSSIASIITGTTILMVVVAVSIYCWKKRNKRQERDNNLDFTQHLLNTHEQDAQKEIIPMNIREQIRNTITDWRKKEKMFVATRASDYVMKCLQKNSCVTLTAPSGVGKSFLCRHIALDLEKKGYMIIPVEVPTDIKTYYHPGKKTVFIVDDICGNFIANQQQIDNWKQLLPVIDTIIADRCCKIIVSCRLQVFKDEKFNMLSPFKSCECNLVSDKLGITSVEKTDIAKNYIGTRMTDIDDLSQNCDFFPLLCSLYNTQKNLDVREYFKNPFDIYKSELDRLCEHGDEGNYKICSLALCVLFNNCLAEKWFLGKVTDEQRHILEDTCNACKINRSTSKGKLKEALDTLDGTFICKQNGIYKTVHDKLFDFLIHYFGKIIIECLIDHCDSILVMERFIWHTSKNDETSNIDFIIKIPDDCLPLYIQRLIKDWSAGKVTVVFNNTNLQVSSFRQSLLNKLKQLNKSKQISLINTKDTMIPKTDCASGNTSLILTCYEGYTDMVQWMLRNDVVVDQCRDNGVSGLCMASQEGHTDIVKLLLEINPDVNLCDNDGLSPLLQASQNGHIDIVKLLLERNPDVNLCDNDGLSPLLQASQNGHADIVKLLLERNPDVNLCNKDGYSPLIQASQNGHTDIVKLLLERNPDVNLCNKDGWTPLLQASQNGNTDIVKLLLEKNPDVNLCNNDGYSPLIQASLNGHTDIVRLLLERNPAPYDNTSLSTSYVYNNISISNSPSLVQPLMKHKPDINAQTYDGNTSLLFSAFHGNLKITKLLLENDADCNICSYSKQFQTDTIIDNPNLTLEEEKKNYLDYLIQNALSYVADYVSKQSVDYVFDLEADCSPLHISCFMGRIDIVCCLLDHNANMNLTKEDGITPLFYACEVGHEAIIHVLLDKGADTQICRLDGKSPVGIAIDNGHTYIVSILTEHKKRADQLPV